ncbi:PKD domain-containing protein [Cellulophaga baltica]|uniref:PKD domain-containing protein n=1 Tax=Cellulophaga TaxID=104264 RepID=UPI001C077E5D|nr:MULTISPECIES: PKD domain-containing protein [Cellulophaga]MBU2997459.1 PKD domain-containing protein [Cellulophaga baltica]MDO6768856.1 PKD domain-containing protein [Cellulophaga sp. 1_MG-2023]
MKKPTYKYILSFISILVIILACTKDVGLYTEVEFELTEAHEADGFINSTLVTTLTVTPEELVEGYEYSYSYNINNGEGYFLDEDGISFSEGEKVSFSPLSTSITYIPTAIGDHSIIFTAEDNFGISEQIIITYSIANILITWTATGPEGPVLLDSSQTITVTLGNEAKETEVTYERNYSITQGNGDLYSSPFGNAETTNEWVEITPDTYELEYIPSELGINTLEFLLQDSNGQEFNATVSFEVVTELASDNDITSFTINDVVGIITDNTIELVLLEDTNLSSLTPEIIHSGVSITPESGTAQDFTNSVTYIVTAENETTQSYIVTVTAPELIENKDITSFSIDGVDGIISGTDITITMPAGTDVTSLSPSITHTGASVNPDNGDAQDFTNPVTYTVTAEDGSNQIYTASVIVETSSSNDITVFTIDGVNGVISGTNITVTMPAGTDVTSLSPSITHTGASVNPDNGDAQDFTNPVTYTVTAEDGSNQIYTASVIVEENQSPTADINTVTSASTGETVTFNGSGSSDPDGDNLTYAWDFGDGNSSTEANPIHSYTTADSYTVTLTVTDDGNPSFSSDEFSHDITITDANQAPTADISGPLINNTGQIAFFEGDGSSDPDGDNLTYTWNTSDGQTSNLMGPEFIFDTPGTYTVTLTVTDDGNPSLSSDEFSHDITVTDANQAPTAVVTSDVTSGTATLDVQFTGSTSTDPDGDTLSYAWNFGDGTGTSTTANPSYSYTTAGTYEVSLIVTDDGTPALSSTEDTITITVTDANQAPTAVVTSDVTSGTATLDVQFTGGTSTDPDGDTLTYAWDFGDGTGRSTTANPSYSYTTEGTYEVSLIVTDDGTPALSSTEDTITITVTDANQAPTAVAISDVTSGTATLDVQFTGSTSTDPDGDTLSYAWDFGDGTGTSTTANPSYSYTTAGTYEVSLIVTDDGTPALSSTEDTITMTVTDANQAPTAVVTSDVTSGTATLDVQFTGSTSTDPDGDTLTYAWDFGNGIGTSTTANPSYSYTTAGTYEVSLIVTDNGTPSLSSTEATITITVTEDNQAPTASIIANPLSGTAPLDVLFVANANDPDEGTLTYAWDFGDNLGASTEATSIYTFTTAGTYEVSLIVTDNGTPALSSTEATVEITVIGANNAPTALASGPDTAITTETVQFDGSSSLDSDGDTITYAWDFGDNIGTSTLENPTYSYATAGTYEVSLIVTDNGTPALSSTESTFEIVVSEPNQAPVAEDFSVTFEESTTSQTHTIDLTPYFSDADSEELVITITSPAEYGNSAVSGTSILYSPNPYYNGEDEITYQVSDQPSDNGSGVDTGIISITITDDIQNEAPIAEDFSVDINANTEENLIRLSSFISDDFTDATNLTISIIEFSSFGQSRYYGQQIIEYTPSQQTTGVDEITYEIIDEDGLSDTGVITINVIAVSQTRPVAVATSDVSSGAATLKVQFTGSNSYDDDDDELSYLWDFGDGNTSIEADPSHSFTTAGTYQVILTVTDDGASELSDTATIEIIVSEPTPTATFSDRTYVTPALNSASGTLIIENGSIVFSVNINAVGLGVGAEITFTIEGEGSWFNFASSGNSEAIVTDAIPPGTYEYSIQAVFENVTGTGNIQVVN